jgi:hypothetical protein
MGVTKKTTAFSRKKGEKSPVTIVYKTKTSTSSFPEKVKRINTLLSKAKLIK